MQQFKLGDLVEQLLGDPKFSSLYRRVKRRKRGGVKGVAIDSK